MPKSSHTKRTKKRHFSQQRVVVVIVNMLSLSEQQASNIKEVVSDAGHVAACQKHNPAAAGASEWKIPQQYSHELLFLLRCNFSFNL